MTKRDFAFLMMGYLVALWMILTTPPLDTSPPEIEKRQLIEVYTVPLNHDIPKMESAEI